MHSGLPFPFAPSLPPRRGFTLVELLVVIAIIAVLMAIIVPSVNGILRKSHQTTSAANLRQWFAGLAASASDNDGEMPTSGYTDGKFEATDEQAWFNRIPKVLKIPSMAEFTPNNQPKIGERSLWINPAVKPTAANKAFTFCYGYNEKLISTATGQDQKAAPLKLAQLDFPALTILMGEKSDGLPHLTMDNMRAYFGSGDPITDPENEANFLFCDGHVAAIRRKLFGDSSLTNNIAAVEQRLTSATLFYRHE